MSCHKTKLNLMGVNFMQKKILSMLLALVMVLAIAPVSVFADDEKVFNGMIYEIVDDEAIIKGYTADLPNDVVIPATIDGYPVTTIGNGAFRACSIDEVMNPYRGIADLKSIILPDSLTTIEDFAFEGCCSLEKIEIPDSVVFIGEFAFAYCVQLKSVVLSKSLVTIESQAFAYCSLEDVEIPDTVTTLGDYVFWNSLNSESIIIPDSVTSLGNGVFALSENLKTVNIGKNITRLNVVVFAGCDITSITIPENITEIHEWAFGGEGSGFELKLNCIYGVPGSAAETYANEKGITFIAIDSEDDVVVPDKPVQDTSTVLAPNANSNITVTDTFANLTPEMTVADIVKSVENENVQILNKNGEVITTDALVGTGSKVQVLDNNGKVLSEYDVVVKADVNGDATITAADARLALRASANLDKIEGVYAIAANYNGDDDITAADARKILRKSAGLE